MLLQFHSQGGALSLFIFIFSMYFLTIFKACFSHSISVFFSSPFLFYTNLLLLTQCFDARRILYRSHCITIVISLHYATKFMLTFFRISQRISNTSVSPKISLFCQQRVPTHIKGATYKVHFRHHPVVRGSRRTDCSDPSQR